MPLNSEDLAGSETDSPYESSTSVPPEGDTKDEEDASSSGGEAGSEAK